MTDANPLESRGFRDIAGGARRGDNPQYQLSRAEYPSPAPFNGEIHSWTYDAIGNRLTNTVNTTTQNYAYLKNGQNPLNGQKLANDGTSAYSYDFNGNTLTRTGFGFGYDAENRLTSITGNETASYTYDYQGRRTSKTVGGVSTTYQYDGLDLIAETTGGQTSYFLNGAGIDDVLAMNKVGQISYMSSDGLGSVVAANDPTGTVTHSVVFDAWGNTKSELGTRQHPFTYTGREVGEAGTLFYRARQYSPGTGRFFQTDPIASQDAYNYVSSSPLRFSDPLGLFEVSPSRIDWIYSIEYNKGCKRTDNAGECASFQFASITCDCRCKGSGFVLRTTLHIGATVRIFNGPFSALKRKPKTDLSVVDAPTARSHVERVHFGQAVDAIRPLVEAFEAPLYPTPEVCESQCLILAERVPDEFREAFNRSQRDEDEGWIP